MTTVFILTAEENAFIFREPEGQQLALNCLLISELFFFFSLSLEDKISLLSIVNLLENIWPMFQLAWILAA